MSNVMNATNVQVTDYRNTVSEFLRNVLPIGEGLYGTRTTPFSEFIGTYYNPANFQNMYEYAYTVVNDAGKPVVSKSYRLPPAESLGGLSTVLDDLASEIFNFTVNDEITSLVRNLNRANYLAGFPRSGAGSFAEVDINTFANGDPNTLISLLGRMTPLALSPNEKGALSQLMNSDLINMLSILKSSGNANAYKLALILCNLTESYFALSSAVNNMVSAALQLVPQVATNTVANPGRTIAIGAVEATPVSPSGNQAMNLQQMNQRYMNDIGLLGQFLAQYPYGGLVYNTLLPLGPNLSETALNNVHLILNGALSDPNRAYNIVMDDVLMSVINVAVAQGSPVNHAQAVAITYILTLTGSPMAANIYQALGIAMGQTYTDILSNMKIDIANGEVIRSVIASRNPQNGNLGKILEHYIKTNLANKRPVRLADVLQFTKTSLGNTTNSITVRHVANYLQAIEPQFYGIANPDAVMQFADILYNLNI